MINNAVLMDFLDFVLNGEPMDVQITLSAIGIHTLDFRSLDDCREIKEYLLSLDHNVTEEVGYYARLV